MSTKVTISYATGAHLYEECFEEDEPAVYLSVFGQEFSVAVDRPSPSAAPATVTVRIPKTVFDKITADYLAARSGHTPRT